MATGNVRDGLDGLDRLELDQGRTVELPGKGSCGLSAADGSGTQSGSLPGRVVYLGGKSSVYGLDPQRLERTRRASRRRNTPHRPRVASLDQSAEAGLAALRTGTGRDLRPWRAIGPLLPQRSCALRKRKSSWSFLLGKKWRWICAARNPSMSPARGRSKSLPVTRCSSAPMTKRLGLINGQVLTISGIAPDGALQTKEGVRVPAEFRQWCHGYVVTSHKAQGWTADHVVVAAERFTAKGAYVACSRGRRSCIVHTPDKARLIERLPEGNRRAALDALSEIHPKNASIVNRVRAWKQLSIDLAQRRRRASNSAIGRPDANCVPAKASEPEYLASKGVRVARQAARASSRTPRMSNNVRSRHARAPRDKRLRL